MQRVWRAGWRATDSSAIFDPVHQAGTIEKYLPKDKFKGELDTATLPSSMRDERNAEEEERQKRLAKVPPLSQCLNLRDFEVVAEQVLSDIAWAYYSSAADDLETYYENFNAFRRIFFRPRILRNVATVNPATFILGYPSSLPLYVTATALGRLGHPDGEKNLTIAAARQGIPQMVPTLSSCSLDEICATRDQNGMPRSSTSCT